MASKAFSKSLLSFYRFLRRRLYIPLSLHRRTPHGSHQKLQKSLLPMEQLSDRTLLFDMEGGLLRSSSTFPYFMLVALEAGGFLRGLLLLLLYPLLCCLSHGVGLRVMVMVCFLGIGKEGLRVGRAVLPKFLLEDLGMEGFEILRRARRRVCYTRMPRVMVEGFLKEYLEVEVVVGRELKEFGGYYTGLMEEESEVELATKILMFDEEDTGEGSFGIGSCTNSARHHLFSRCKELHLVTEDEKRTWHALPREGYPKALVFHDGRLASRPTPTNTLVMFLWLPLGVPLSIFRSLVLLLLPYKIFIPIGAFSGMKSRLKTPPTFDTQRQPNAPGHLYVCNHRTLLDPIYISAALNKLVTAVTYSISPISKALSPIRTVGLTRDKEEDRRRMADLLNQGDLVVCPEGTTCREPYLLRFSPLFAELTDTVIPVALVTRVSMFYGTTASGFKFLDPFYFLANPCPEYDVDFLNNVSMHSIAGRSCSSHEVANHVQRRIGDALAFHCTALTRKNKYLMLAGNEGIVNTKPKRL